MGLCIVVRSSVEGVLSELADPRRAPTVARTSANSFETEIATIMKLQQVSGINPSSSFKGLIKKISDKVF